MSNFSLQRIRQYLIYVVLPPPGQCENSCESSSCLLVQAEELKQVADTQVARHVLLCLLLTVSLLAVSKPPPFTFTVTGSPPHCQHHYI